MGGTSPLLHLDAGILHLTFVEVPVTKVRLLDMVIILPGLTGSVLQKDGQDLWALSPQAGFNALVSRGRSFDDLLLGDDDPDADFLDDGIRATRLIEGVQLVPGLAKIDGYAKLRSALLDRFDCVAGDVSDNKPANLFEFPYDWRRDAGVAARLLQKFVEERLPRWRVWSGANEAKVILLAHSLGGLVARHYLEVLGGWEHSRCLFSFGTPYRGAPMALGYLANGYKQFMLDLTTVMRSFTSVYQLLPIYEAVNDRGRFKRVAECDGLPNVDSLVAKRALAFHRKIEDAAHLNSKEERYRVHYKTIPVVGTQQDTLQSARWDGVTLVMDKSLPPVVPASQSGGDGTVPRISAVPIELSKEGYLQTFLAERHSSLQANDRVLDDLLERLVQMQEPNLAAVRGPEAKPRGFGRQAIRLQLEDLYAHEEPVHIQAEVSDGDTIVNALKAEVEAISSPGPVWYGEFQPVDGGWELRINQLPAGVYRLRVRALPGGVHAPSPVHDVFAVVD